MIIKGNTVGTPTPRTDWNQTNPKKADYLKGKEDLERIINNAQTAADDAQTAADNAQTAADNAQTAADNAQTAAENAQSAADNGLPMSGGSMTGNVEMGGNKVTGLGEPTESGDATNKEYVDSKHDIFTATITTNDWTGDTAPYTQTIGVEGILATDTPHVMPVYSDDLETALLEKEAWSLVDSGKTAEGSIIFSCFDDKPETAINIQIEVNR